jgi:hypothetical protein
MAAAASVGLEVFGVTEGFADVTEAVVVWGGAAGATTVVAPLSGFEPTTVAVDSFGSNIVGGIGFGVTGDVVDDEGGAAGGAETTGAEISGATLPETDKGAVT